MIRAVYITERMSKNYTSLIVANGHADDLERLADRLKLYYQDLNGRQFIGIPIDKDYYFNLLYLCWFLNDMREYSVFICHGLGRGWHRIDSPDKFRFYVSDYFMLELSSEEKDRLEEEFDVLLAKWKQRREEKS